MTVDVAYRWLWIFMLFSFSVLIILCLIRGILGKSIADRFVAINLIGTLITCMIGIVALYLRENYLFDICLVYTMLSFLAIVVLSKLLR